MSEAKEDELDFGPICPVCGACYGEHRPSCVPALFRTEDGYTLRSVDGAWTDGDLTFVSDADGLPMDDTGEALDGRVIG